MGRDEPHPRAAARPRRVGLGLDGARVEPAGVAERERRPVEPAGDGRHRARHRHGPAPPCPLAVPPAPERDRLRRDHRQSGARRRRRLSAGLGLERVRPGRPHRCRPLAPPDGRAERRAERRRRLRAAALHRDRHDGVRPRRPHRRDPLVAPAREPTRAVHRHRARRRPGPRLLQHTGLPAGRARGSLRALRTDGEDRLAVRHDRASLAATGGRGRGGRGTPSASTRRGTSTPATPTRGRGADRNGFRTAASSPATRAGRTR